MAREKELRVLVATDGSRQAQAAIATAVHFPWPARTRVRTVIARRTRKAYTRSILLTAIDRGAEIASNSARRTLSRRWPDVEIEVVDKAPVVGILEEAERFHADVIVVGWRGHGTVRRLLMGSVSRGVVRGAHCAVLVVRRPQRVERLVVGFDSSPAAKRVLAFVGRLAPPTNGHVTLVSGVELMTVPSQRLVPGAAAIAHEVRRTNSLRTRTATKELNRAAAELKQSGWRTRILVVHGEPLRDLLGAVGAARAQLLVVGARGTSGVRRLLLGSVAEGALNRSPVAVLVAR
jgi:nucleotide-binding universal stress UspA family protein